MKQEETTKLQRGKAGRTGRYFSESARRAIVKEVEEGLGKSEASRKYQVSQTAVYRWLRLYSDRYERLLVTVVEHESDAKKNKTLEAKLEEVYSLLGRSQAENMFLAKVVELAGEHFKADLKKSFGTPPSPPSTKNAKKAP